MTNLMGDVGLPPREVVVKADQLLPSSINRPTDESSEIRHDKKNCDQETCASKAQQLLVELGHHDARPLTGG